MSLQSAITHLHHPKLPLRVATALAALLGLLSACTVQEEDSTASKSDETANRERVVEVPLINRYWGESTTFQLAGAQSVRIVAADFNIAIPQDSAYEESTQVTMTLEIVAKNSNNETISHLLPRRSVIGKTLQQAIENFQKTFVSISNPVPIKAATGEVTYGLVFSPRNDNFDSKEVGKITLALTYPEPAIQSGSSYQLMDLTDVNRREPTMLSIHNCLKESYAIGDRVSESQAKTSVFNCNEKLPQAWERLLFSDGKMNVCNEESVKASVPLTVCSCVYTQKNPTDRIKRDASISENSSNLEIVQHCRSRAPAYDYTRFFRPVR